ncbi:MAG: WYL domain-containing protein [Magnetococcales bacterium]|nr:WYL domain-containing protein [Magnetococcales bacterium]
MPAKKNPDATRGQNLIKLFTLLLFSGKPYSLGELAEKLQCSKPTMMRLIDDLSATGGIFIQDWLEGGKRWVQIPAYQNHLPEPELSPKAIQRLVLCQEFLTHLLPHDFISQLECDIAVSASRIKDRKERMRSTRSLAATVLAGSVRAQIRAKLIEESMVALGERHLLRVTYQSLQNGETKSYPVVPQQIISSNNALYLKSWIVHPTPPGEKITAKYEQPTLLAFHRIMDLELLDSHYGEGPWDEDMEKEKKTFGVSSGPPFRAKVRFAKRAAMHAKERFWSQDQEIAPLENGEIVLAFTATSEREVVSQVLGYGDQAEMLEPHKLREMVFKELVHALSQYKDIHQD